MVAAVCAGVSPPRAVYLVPERFEARVGEVLEMSAAAWGEDGQRVEIGFDAARAAWFFVRVAGTQENADDPPPAAPGAGAGAPQTSAVAVVHAGVTMIGADFRPRVIEVAAEEFRALLETAATDEVRSAVEKDLPAERPVRVRHIASAKALVSAREADGKAPAIDAATATSKAGQVAEIRLLNDPMGAGPGDEIQIRTYASSSAAGDARVRAWRIADGEGKADAGAGAVEFTTDSSGIGRFTVSAAGVWRIEFHSVRGLKDDAEADVEVQSATVIFRAGEGGGR